MLSRCSCTSRAPWSSSLPCSGRFPEDGPRWPPPAKRRESSSVFDFSLDPTKVYTFWAGLFGGIALTLATHGTDQFLVQRLLSARSARDAGRGLILSGFIVFAQFMLFLVDRRHALHLLSAHAAAARAHAHRRDPAALRRERASAGRGRVHRRGHCRRRAFSIDQCARGHDRQRLLREVRPAGRRRGSPDAAVTARDDRLGHRPDWRRARCAMDRSVRARCGPARAVLLGRTGARCVPDRRAHSTSRICRDALGHDWRHAGCDVCLVDECLRLDVVRARWLGLYERSRAWPCRS